MPCSGWSESCIATHPSDFCVPLVALDAVVEIEGKAGRREVPLENFHRLPGDTPRARERARAWRADRRCPSAGRGGGLRGTRPLPQSPGTHLLRVRRRVGRRGTTDRGRHDRRSANCARRRRRKTLAGTRGRGGAGRRTAERAAFRRAAEAALADAKSSGDNAFKIELARRIVTRALTLAAAGTPERVPALPASPFALVPGVLADA